MINTIDFDGAGSDDKQSKLNEISEAIKADCIDQKTYEEIYSMIPQELLAEKDRLVGNIQAIGFETRMTKRMLNKKEHKALLEELRDYAQKNNLIKNQLFFNKHFDEYFIRTIYKPS